MKRLIAAAFALPLIAVLGVATAGGSPPNAWGSKTRSLGREVAEVAAG